MAGNFAAIKAKARRDVHRAFGVAASHTDVVSGVLTEDLSVRWHNKQVLLGDLQDSGYASVIEGIERVIFERAELVAKGITLKKGDVITITAEGFENAKLIIHEREPIVGPIEVKWWVAR